MSALSKRLAELAESGQNARDPDDVEAYAAWLDFCILCRDALPIILAALESAESARAQGLREAAAAVRAQMEQLAGQPGMLADFGRGWILQCEQSCLALLPAAEKKREV